MPMLSAVMFDLFETLVTEQGIPAKPTETVARELGVGVDEFAREWRARQHNRMTGVCRDYPTALRSVCAALHHPADGGTVARLHQERMQAKAEAFRVVEEPADCMLREIRRRGLKTALISNCTSEEVSAWATSVLAPCFDEVVFSFEARLVKPDVAIYHLACRRLGVAPGECVFIGDGGSQELRGAVDAGMAACQALWFVRRRSPTPEVERFLQSTAGYPGLAHPRDVFGLV